MKEGMGDVVGEPVLETASPHETRKCAVGRMTRFGMITIKQWPLIQVCTYPCGWVEMVACRCRVHLFAQNFRIDHNGYITGEPVPKAVAPHETRNKVQLEILWDAARNVF